MHSSNKLSYQEGRVWAKMNEDNTKTDQQMADELGMKVSTFQSFKARAIKKWANEQRAKAIRQRRGR